MSFISMGDVDLLHPPRELEQRRHKLKRLVQSPNSFFIISMDQFKVSLPAPTSKSSM